MNAATAYTSRSDFPATLPAKNTAYCWGCGAPEPTVSRDSGRWLATCHVCGKSYPRVRVWNPTMEQSFDEQGRLVHASAGVFMINAKRQLLLFQRNKFPLLLTVPAGHVDAGEDPLHAAVRETREETGVELEPAALTSIFSDVIEGDSCIGGADIHHWHGYAVQVADDILPRVTADEGAGWGWYDIDSLNANNTTQPVVHILAEPTVRERLAQLA